MGWSRFHDPLFKCELGFDPGAVDQEDDNVKGVHMPSVWGVVSLLSLPPNPSPPRCVVVWWCGVVVWHGVVVCDGKIVVS